MKSPLDNQGFTLIELMIVVVIIGILAAIAVPNAINLTDRAKEGATRQNMHTFQTAAEDEAIQNNGYYPTDAADVATNLVNNFDNPFAGTAGDGNSWEDRSTMAGDPTNKSGIVSYADSAQSIYNIKGYGKKSVISVVLSTGQ